MKRPDPRPLALPGLRTAPSQVFGALRLVPLLRDRVRHDLRLGLRPQAQDLTVVALDRSPEELQERGGLAYVSFVPHAMVCRWSEDGSPVGALGGQLLDDRSRRKGPIDGFRVRFEHRMAKREAADLVRFLPLHLAMEHFLALCFGGPEIAWPEWSRRALTQGLDPRIETAMPGDAIRGLEEALRMFEIHDGQVGVALLAADTLATLFVVPHPDDYRAMHRSLLRDLYGELVWHHALTYRESAEVTPTLDAARVTDLGSLRGEVARARLHWAEAHQLMLGDVLGRPVRRQTVQRMGPFVLDRFFTALDPGVDGHLGESIVHDDGELLYLKTLRLTRAQTKRAFLLHTLATNDWHLDRTAAALRATRRQLLERLVRADLGWMVRPEVLAELRR